MGNQVQPTPEKPVKGNFIEIYSTFKKSKLESKKET